MVRKLQISEIYYKNKSKRPADALAVKAYITHLLTTWNQEMLAHLKSPFHICSDLLKPLSIKGVKLGVSQVILSKIVVLFLWC